MKYYSSYSFFPCVFLFLFTFFFFLGLFCCSASPNNVFLSACKDAANGDPNINYDFCVSCLKENPRSATASIKGLVKISMAATKSNATEIKTLIAQLLTGNNLSQRAESSLNSCAEVYSEAIYDLKDANAAIKVKDYYSANVHISAAMDAPDTCEQGFEEEGEMSPLTKENKMFFQLTAMALAFLTMIS